MRCTVLWTSALTGTLRPALVSQADDLSVEEVDGGRAPALDRREHRRPHPAIAQADGEQQRVLRGQAHEPQRGRSRSASARTHSRSSVPATFSSVDPLGLRDRDRLGHDLEREPAVAALAHQRTQPLAGDRAERRDRAVERELAPAGTAQVLRVHAPARSPRAARRRGAGRCRGVVGRPVDRSRTRRRRYARSAPARASTRPTPRSPPITRSAPTIAATRSSHRPFWKTTTCGVVVEVGQGGARGVLDVRRLGREDAEVVAALGSGETQPRTTRSSPSSTMRKPALSTAARISAFVDTTVTGEPISVSVAATIPPMPPAPITRTRGPDLFSTITEDPFHACSGAPTSKTRCGAARK